MQSLLAGTYQQLNVVSTQLLQAQTGLKQAANMLSCATKVILMMMQFQHHLSDEVRARPGAAAPVCAPRASLSGSKVVCCEPFLLFLLLSEIRRSRCCRRISPRWCTTRTSRAGRKSRTALSPRCYAQRSRRRTWPTTLCSSRRSQRCRTMRSACRRCARTTAAAPPATLVVGTAAATHIHIGCCSQPIATAATPRAVSFRLPARTHMMLTHMLGGGVALLACSRTAHCIDVRSTRQSRFGQARHAQEEGGGGCRGTAQVKRRQQRRSVPTT